MAHSASDFLLFSISIQLMICDTTGKKMSTHKIIEFDYSLKFAILRREFVMLLEPKLNV